MTVVRDPLKVDEMLRQGLKVTTIMDRTQWGRAQITARATRMRMLIDPAADKAYQLTDDEVDEARERLHAAPERPEPPRPTPVPSTLRGAPPVRPGRIDALLAAAEASGIPSLTARAETIRKRVEELAGAVRREQDKAKARAEVAELERRLAAARARVRNHHVNNSDRAPLTPEQIEVRRVNGRKASERLNAICAQFNVTAADIRAWCRQHDASVPITGPMSLRQLDAYEAAHTGQEAAS